MQISCKNISMIGTAITIANNGSVSRFIPRTTTLATLPTSDMGKSILTSHTCSSADCMAKPISRCTVCHDYYCYDHVYGHIHRI